MKKINKYKIQIQLISILTVIFIFSAGDIFAEQNNQKQAGDPNGKISTAPAESAKDSNNPNQLLEGKWQEVSKVLLNQQLAQEQKEKQIEEIMNPVFDFTLMSKLALGKENWSKFNPQQRDKFINLFVEKLKKTYLEKITLYKDEKVFFGQASPTKNGVQVPMKVISNDKGTAILYKLHKLENSWKIYDVEVEGVSILLTYRSQFNDILRNHSVDDLLLQLEKKPTGEAPSKRNS